jgi:hypothetical protein
MGIVTGNMGNRGVAASPLLELGKGEQMALTPLP